MLNYSAFIKESNTNPEMVYWSWEKILDKNWKNIIIKDNQINIVLEDDDRHTVLLEVEGNNEMLKLPSDAIEPFWKKFAIEFKKNPSDYIDQMSYVPKCCGKVDQYRKAKQFDM